MDDQVIIKYLSYDLKREIMLKMTPEDLQKTCRASKEMSDICSDASFWREKIMEDFKRKNTLGDLTLKETWIALHNKLTFDIKIDFYEVGDDEAPIDDFFTFSYNQRRAISDVVEESTKDYIYFQGEDFFDYFEYNIDFENKSLTLTLFLRKNLGLEDHNYAVDSERFDDYIHQINRYENIIDYDDNQRSVGIVLEFS